MMLPAVAGLLLLGTAAASVAGTLAQIKVEQAKVEFSNKNYQGAMTLLTAALAEEPGNPEALHYAGLSQMGLKQPSAALPYFEKTAAALPKSAPAQEDVAWAAVEAKQFDQALAAADKALALNPASDRAKLLKGQALVGLKRYPEAQTALAGVSESGEFGQAALFYQGLALANQGKTEDAAAMFKRAAAKGPDTPLGKEAQSYVNAISGGVAPSAKPKPYSFRFRVMYQYDTNIAVVNDPDLLPEQISNKEDARITLDMDARYNFINSNGLLLYGRYVGYAGFQLKQSNLNIMHNVGQIGTFYKFPSAPITIGAKSDYAHSTLEGYYYESFYQVNPEIRVNWNSNLMTRLVGHYGEESFENPGDDGNCRNNHSAGGTIYQHVSFLDGKLSAWAGYGFERWMAGGANYNRYANAGHLGVIATLPADIQATFMARYEAISYPDYRPGNREEHKTSLNLSFEVPITKALNAYLGAGYTTVDANARRFEYERWIYSAGMFVEL
jgi:tetratricopeptide (TPR) repeat protein